MKDEVSKTQSSEDTLLSFDKNVNVVVKCRSCHYHYDKLGRVIEMPMEVRPQKSY